MELLRRSIEDAPIIEQEGYPYVLLSISNGIPMLRPQLLREVVNGVVRVADLANVDKIVTPEAMGIQLSTAVSLTTDIPLVVVRKREYGLDGEVSLSQRTAYSERDMYLNDVDEGDRVLVLDNLTSRGGTLAAVTSALDEVGAEVVDVVSVVRRVGEDETVDCSHEVTSLVDIEVDGDEVRVVREYDEAQ